MGIWSGFSVLFRVVLLCCVALRIQPGFAGAPVDTATRLVDGAQPVDAAQEACESALAQPQSSSDFSQQAISLYRAFYRTNRSRSASPFRLPKTELVNETLHWMRAQLEEIQSAVTDESGRSEVLDDLIRRVTNLENEKESVDYRNYLDLSHYVVSIVSQRTERTLPEARLRNSREFIERGLDRSYLGPFTRKVVQEIYGKYIKNEEPLPHYFSDRLLKANTHAFLFLPVARELGIRDFNDISAYPIFPLALTHGWSEADGTIWLPERFFNHDEGHAQKLIYRYAFLEADPGKLSLFLSRPAILFPSADLYVGKGARFNRWFRSQLAQVQDPKLVAAVELLQFRMTHEAGTPMSRRLILRAFDAIDRYDWQSSKDDLRRRVQRPFDLGAFWPFSIEELDSSLNRARIWMLVQARLWVN